MARTIIAISGTVAAGKSTLAGLLHRRYGAYHRRTHELLRSRADAQGLGPLTTRRALQHYGEELDDKTGGQWLADDLAPYIAGLPDRSVVVVDAIRVQGQLDALHRAFGRRVTHVHLQAAQPTLESRYEARRGTGTITELGSYEQVRQDPTERAVGDLAVGADIVINTDDNQPEDVLIRCAASVGLLPTLNERLVDVVVGGQYGSEGKGNVCFYLAPEYDVLVRVGGANAGHKVPTDPVTTHRLLPSGTLSNEAAQLVLGPGAVLDLDALFDEMRTCRVEADRLTIDPQALIVEQADRDAEDDLAGIASTRQGVGRASARRINGRGTYPEGLRLARDVPDLAPFTARRASDVLQDAYSRGARVLLEGTQGTGLSIFHGDYPYVTSRDTTASGCLAEAGIGPGRVRRVIMVVRTYPIRVGGPSGPMGTELTLELVAARAGLPVQDVANREIGSVSGSQRRIGLMEWEALRRAAELNAATDVALTFADYVDAANRDVRRFDQLTGETIRLIDEVEQVAGCRVSLVSTGFDRRGLLDRRDWRGQVSDPPATS